MNRSHTRRQHLLLYSVIAGILALFLSSLLGSSVNAAFNTTYKQINNTDIEAKSTYTGGTDQAPPTQYYSSRPLTDKFYSITSANKTAEICEQWIAAVSSSIDRLYTIPFTGGLCQTTSTSKAISVDRSGKDILFYEDAGGTTIKPALRGSSNSEFTRITKTSTLGNNNNGLASGERMYIQTQPNMDCPRLLVAFASNRWGFISPESTQDVQSSPESLYYQKVLAAEGITDKGSGCKANGQISKYNTEKGLSDVVGGEPSIWTTYDFGSFHGISGSVKLLGNAVGNVSAAKLIRNEAEKTAIIPDIALGANDGGTTTESPNSCAIDGIGWLICPVVNFMAGIVDSSYGVVSALLTTPNVNLDTGSDMYKAWAIMRTFANVAFVIAFLIIIFSQLTSVGITNYGVKKMLPRLIVAAILVNVSYFICAIAVDASNIAGSSIKQLLDGVGGQLASPVFAQGAGQNGNGWTGIVSFVLLGGALLYAQLSVLLPALIAALVAIVTVFLILTLRQALLVLLIVISPLAFVAYLLPNTESLFTKWRKLFMTLLLMYPIIAGIFGLSSLASTIIMASSTDMPVQIMGALVAIIPLFITPIIMKSAGGLLNRFGGMVNNPNKGPFDRLRKGAEGYRNNRKEFRNLKAITGDGRTMPGVSRFARAKADRTAILENRKRNLGLATADMIADKSKEDAGFRGQLAKGGGAGADQRAFANAISVQADLQAKEVNAAAVIIEDLNLSSAQVKALATGGSATSASGQVISGADSVMRKAAIKQAVSIGTVGDVEDIIKSSGSMDSDQRKLLSSSVASSGITAKATHLAGRTLDDIAQGDIQTDADLDRVTARAINSGKYSAAKIVQNEPASLERVIRVVNTGVLDEPGGVPADGAVIRTEATKAIREPTLSVQITTGQNPLIDQLII